MFEKKLNRENQKGICFLNSPRQMHVSQCPSVTVQNTVPAAGGTVGNLGSRTHRHTEWSTENQR